MAERHIASRRTMTPNKRKKTAQVGYTKLDYQTKNLHRDLALHKAYNNFTDKEVVSDVSKPENFEEYKRAAMRRCKTFINKHVIKMLMYVANSSSAGQSLPQREFILDTGASRHMCCDLMLTLAEKKTLHVTCMLYYIRPDLIR